MELLKILEGHKNELLKKNEDLSKKRISICLNCPLCKKTNYGLICDNNLFINNDGKTKTKYEDGYFKGCGCRLSAKTRLKQSKCIINKW